MKRTPDRVPRDAEHRDAQFTKAAKRLHEESGTLEIAEYPGEVSSGPPGSGGAYVMAWVWVSDAEADKEE